MWHQFLVAAIQHCCLILLMTQGAVKKKNHLKAEVEFKIISAKWKKRSMKRKQSQR